MELNKLKQLLDKLTLSEQDKKGLLGIMDLKIEDDMEKMLERIDGMLKTQKEINKTNEREFKILHRIVIALLTILGGLLVSRFL